METLIKLTSADFNENLIKSLKRVFKGRNKLDITINIKENKKEKYLYKETREEYFAKLNKAIEDVEKGNVISFTMQ